MRKTYSVNRPALPAKQIRSFSPRHLALSIIAVLLLDKRDASMQTFHSCESVVAAFNPIYPAKRRKKRTPWCGWLLIRLPPYGSLIPRVYFGAGSAVALNAPFFPDRLDFHEYWLVQRMGHIWIDQKNGSNSKGGKLSSSKALNELKLLL